MLFRAVPCRLLCRCGLFSWVFSWRTFPCTRTLSTVSSSLLLLHTSSLQLTMASSRYHIADIFRGVWVLLFFGIKWDLLNCENWAHSYPHACSSVVVQLCHCCNSHFKKTDKGLLSQSVSVPRPTRASTHNKEITLGLLFASKDVRLNFSFWDTPESCKTSKSLLHLVHRPKLDHTHGYSRLACCYTRKLQDVSFMMYIGVASCSPFIL